MTMLSPRDAYSLWDDVPGALVKAVQEAVFDFAAGEMKPWAYYPGVFTGVLANSEPGLGAIVYFVGSAIDVVYRTGPDAGDIRWFVDGVAQSDISAYAASETWETLHLDDLIDGVIHVLELRNTESATAPGNENIMALGNFTVTGTAPAAAGFPDLLEGVWKVSITVKDDKGKRSTHSLYLPMDSYTYTEAVSYAHDYALTISLLVGGQIIKVKLATELTDMYLPAAEPEPDSDVEEGLRATYRVYKPSGAVYKRIGFRSTLATWKDEYLLPPDQFEELRKPTFHPDVTAWRNLMSMATTLGYPSNPSDRRGWKIAYFKKSYQVFRKSRK